MGTGSGTQGCKQIFQGNCGIEKKEVKPFGGIYSLEFDEEGEIDVYFLPIRPGKYDFYVENYRESGMLGQIIVK